MNSQSDADYQIGPLGTCLGAATIEGGNFFFSEYQDYGKEF